MSQRMYRSAVRLVIDGTRSWPDTTVVSTPSPKGKQVVTYVMLPALALELARGRLTWAPAPTIVRRRTDLWCLGNSREVPLDCRSLD